MLRGIAEAEQRRSALATEPLEPISAVLARLIDIERRCPDVVASLLVHPATGLWAARVLGHLRAASSGGPTVFSPDDDEPSWHLFGYVHCMAAAALIRSRTPGSIKVPTGPHGIHLPALGTVHDSDLGRHPGCAQVQVGEDGTATVESEKRRVTLPSDLRQSAPHWKPAPVLVWCPTDTPHTLAVEDPDLHPGLLPDAGPLSATETERWQLLLDEAGALLAARHPASGRMLALTLRTLVPLPTMPQFRLASATYAEAFGHAVVSLPHSAAELAVALVHEARHSVLNALVHQIRLIDPVRAPLLYAPWRSDPRPAQGLLHGVYSFAGVTEFWRTERRALTGRHSALAHFEFAVWRRAVVGALLTLRTEGELSPWGERFIAGIEGQAADWANESVPEEFLRRAEEETADRWATWRIRNMEPPEEETAEQCARWLDGAESCRRPDRSQLHDVSHTALPESRTELRRSHLIGSREAPGAATADLCLIRGEAVAARDAYTGALRRDPSNRSAWVGLGLALRLTDEPHSRAAARTLLNRPELVRTVQLRLREQGSAAPDPIELADWIGR